MPRVTRPILLFVLTVAWAAKGRVAYSAPSDALWNVGTPARGQPVVVGTSAYFLGDDHKVRAVDVETGGVKWTTSTGEAGSAMPGAHLVAADGLVIVGDYNVVAFDQVTGVQRWRFRPVTGYGAGLYIGSVGKGVVFAGSPAGVMYAIDTRTGRERWVVVLDEGRAATVFRPLSEGANVVAGYTVFQTPKRGGVIVVDAETGALRWKKPFPPSADATLPTNWAGGPLIVDGLVIATSGEGVIHALALSNKRELWTIANPARWPNATADFRPLARAGDLLLAGSLNGDVVAYDLRTLQLRWRKEPEEGSVSFEISSDSESVFVPFASGSVIAFDVRDGSVQWRRGGSSSGYIWPPIVSGGKIYFAGSQSGLSAFAPTR